MFFKYGNHSHPVGEVEISQLRARAIFSSRGYPESTLRTMSIAGELLGENNVDVNNSIIELENAYSTQGLVAALHFGEPNNDGGFTAHSWFPSDTLGGIRIVGFDYGNSPGEFANHRTFSITFEALFPNYSRNVLSFEETLRFVGTSGKRFVWRLNLDTDATKQRVNKKTTMRATQSGRILGYRSLPARPSPRWPKDEHVEQRQVTILPPTEMAGTLANFGISYSYSFEFGNAVKGFPQTPLGQG